MDWKIKNSNSDTLLKMFWKKTGRSQKQKELTIWQLTIYEQAAAFDKFRIPLQKKSSGRP